jgi:dihydrofolate reductase
VYALLLDHTDRLEITDVDVAVGHGTSAPAIGPERKDVGVDPVQGWHTAASGVRYRFRTLRRPAS